MYGWIERWKMDGKKPDWGEIFDACREAGLDAVEIDATPEKHRLARACGLSVSASYLGLPLHLPFEELDIHKTVLPFAERLAATEGTDLILNADPIDWKSPVQKTEEQFQYQGENLSRIAELVTPMGLEVCLHNHSTDSYTAEGDLRSVIDYADKNVGLCVDTGWAHVAGMNPIAWITSYPERIFAFHFRNHRGNVPTEDLLEGELDIEAVVDAAKAADYEGWFSLELWHPEETRPERSMTEDVRRSIDYLKEII